MCAAFDIARQTEGRAELCRSILEGLPEWFGRRDARERYLEEAAQRCMWVCRVEGHAVGFATQNPQTEACDELHLIGVEKAHHGRGFGRGLVKAVAEASRKRGASLLSVKTLAETHPDPNYAKTRAFYRSCGFLPVETLPTFWGEDIPCLLLVKPLFGD